MMMASVRKRPSVRTWVVMRTAMAMDLAPRKGTLLSVSVTKGLHMTVSTNVDVAQIL